MMTNKLLYLNDHYRPDDNLSRMRRFESSHTRIASKVEFFNDSGERIWEPLHNKTVIAGSALTAMKLFNLDRNVLDFTPTYEQMFTGGLIEGGTGTTYPTRNILDDNGSIVGSVEDETQRTIIGFCVGQGGAGIDISDVFEVEYCSCITVDNIVPFRYPLVNADNIDEEMYKGKKLIELSDGSNRHAYYFKEFSNTPNLVQNYVSTIGSFSDSVNPNTVYTNKIYADKAQSYVELHLKITSEDCREFFITHKGLENAKINQISLVSGWKKTVSVTKLDKASNMQTKDIEYFQDIRPFSVINIPNEILSDRSKSISCLYTLYF